MRASLRGPQVKWAQRQDSLYLTIDLRDVRFLAGAPEHGACTRTALTGGTRSHVLHLWSLVLRRSDSQVKDEKINLEAEKVPPFSLSLSPLPCFPCAFSLLGTVNPLGQHPGLVLPNTATLLLSPAPRSICLS